MLLWLAVGDSPGRLTAHPATFPADGIQLKVRARKETKKNELSLGWVDEIFRHHFTTNSKCRINVRSGHTTSPARIIVQMSNPSARNLLLFTYLLFLKYLSMESFLTAAADVVVVVTFVVWILYSWIIYWFRRDWCALCFLVPFTCTLLLMMLRLIDTQKSIAGQHCH